MKNEELAKLIRSQDKRIYRVEEAIIKLNHATGEISGLLAGIKEVHENTNTWMKILCVATPLGVPMGVIAAWLLNRVLGA